MHEIQCQKCGNSFSVFEANCPACNWENASASRSESGRNLLSRISPPGDTLPPTPDVNRVADQTPSDKRNKIEESVRRGDSDAPPEFVAAIERFGGDKSYENQRCTIIAIFGLTSAGKTFLNQRIGALFAGRARNELTGPQIGGTPSGSGTSHEFPFKHGPSERQSEPFLIVDISGEDFIEAGRNAATSLAFDMLFANMKALILYLPLPVLRNSKDWKSRNYGPHSARHLYSTVISKVHEAHKKDGEVRATLPIFLALSKADAEPDGEQRLWPAILRGEGCDPTALSLVEKHAPQIASTLADHHAWVSYGFVASHVGAAPADANEDCDSFGVEDMLLGVRRLVEAARDGNEVPTLVSEYVIASGVHKRAKRRALAGFMERIALHLERSLLHWHWRPIKRSVRTALSTVLAISVIGLGGLLSWNLAKSQARVASERLNQSFSALKHLPDGFAVRPSDIWTLSAEEAARMLSDVQREQLSFGIGGDSLVRAPNSELSPKVHELDVDFWAFAPDPSTPNGREVTRIYGALRQCSLTERACATQGLSGPPPAAKADDRTKRAYSYATALYAYSFEPRNKDTNSRIRKRLEQFESERKRSIGDSYFSKQVWLPYVTASLMIAHHDYAINAGKQQALIDYGRALDEAIKPPKPGMVAISSDAFEMIGVSQPIFAMHLLASILAEADAVSELGVSVNRRLKSVGYADFAQSWETSSRFQQVGMNYPDLNCIAFLLMSHSPASTSKPVSRWTRRVCEEAGNKGQRDKSPVVRQIWERSLLAAPQTWQNLSQEGYEDINFDRYMRHINAAAAQVPTNGLPESSIRELTRLATLKQPRATSELLDSHGLAFWTLIATLVVSALSSVVLYRVLCLHSGRALAIIRMTRDK